MEEKEQEMTQKGELKWDADDRSFDLNGIRFVTVHGGGGFGEWIPGENSLLFYKTRALVEQYLDWFARLAEPPKGGNLVELGLFDGGSIPFWFEILAPDRHVGIDIRSPRTPGFLGRYLDDENRRGRISMHWGTDQTDATALGGICADAFSDDPIDLVIDDASHLYEQTRRSFEILFPRLRPGSGLYIIEDWAWAHWKGIEEEWKGRRPLTELVSQIVEMAGSTGSGLVLDLFVCSGFVAIRRGWSPSSDFAPFSVEGSIYRHPR